MSLRRALTESSLRPLPDRVRVLLEGLDAPSRLAAHLRAVHDVAWELGSAALPGAALLFGAAVHDIRKSVHVGELSGPGHVQERAGYEVLLARHG